MGDEQLSVHGTKDPELVSAAGRPLRVAAIDGVVARSLNVVLTDNGALTEIWRRDWALDAGGVDQVFQRTLAPGAVSAWHVHLQTTDRLFCARGQILLVLYDARTASPTHGVVAEHRLGERRPAVVSVPAGVYHGVRALGATEALIVNAVDRAYVYEDPDHWRVPIDSDEIPYRW